MKILYKSIFFTALLIAFGCNDDFENPVENTVITSGDANFSKYVAIGNSLTSGYADNALYQSAQQNSFPAILAAQMSAAGGGAFTQPLMLDDIGGFADLGVPGRLTLQIINGSPAPVPTPAQSAFQSSFVQGPFNNMGVPGAKSFHLVAQGYGNPAGIAQGLANPYFARMATSAQTSIMADVMAQQPTFFTLWIGNNDVLSFATSGGVGTNQAGNLNPATYGGNDITDPQVYASVMQQIIEALAVNAGAKGAVANLPNVTSIPYFTTVPVKPLTADNAAYAAQIPMLNQFFGSLNQVFDALNVPERKINFDAGGASGIVFVDDSLPDLSAQISAVLTQVGVPAAQAQLMGMTYGQVRQSKEGDLIPLTMSSRIGSLDTNRLATLMQMGLSQEQAGQLSVVGLTYPHDEFVLSQDEINQITTAVNQFNGIIAQLAGNYGLALVDMNRNMGNLQSGITYNGVGYNAGFITGGAFSLDGVHLNGRGYALVANYFIDAINHKFGSNLRQVNVNNYSGITLP
ncbi:MAG: G-D-S-L family lipolytic protein [Flavobacteriaceae bacterium]|nr:G-D-S-L family lipolytic protein [Flavobacteriaceae bacterium]